MVPNAFTVGLGEHDHARLEVYREALGSELADMVREHAEEQRYAFIGPVSVEFELDDELDTGRFHVRSAAVAGATGRTQDTVSHAGAATPWVEVGSTTYALARPTTTHRPRGRGRPAHRRPRHLPRPRRAAPLRR